MNSHKARSPCPFSSSCQQSCRRLWLNMYATPFQATKFSLTVSGHEKIRHAKCLSRLEGVSRSYVAVPLPKCCFSCLLAQAKSLRNVHSRQPGIVSHPDSSCQRFVYATVRQFQASTHPLPPTDSHTQECTAHL